jgi:hypothetical protein
VLHEHAVEHGEDDAILRLEKAAQLLDTVSSCAEARMQGTTSYVRAIDKVRLRGFEAKV